MRNFFQRIWQRLDLNCASGDSGLAKIELARLEAEVMYSAQAKMVLLLSHWTQGRGPEAFLVTGRQDISATCQKLTLGTIKSI